MTRPGPKLGRRPLDGPALAPVRALRGLLVGVVTGVGALVAHHLAGGQPSAGVAAIVTALAVAAGVAFARWRIGGVAALGLAVATQGVAHLLMAGSAGHTSMHHDHAGAAADAPWSAATMVLGHVVVALATTALARGADQVVLDLVWTLVSWFLGRSWLPLLPLATTRAAHRNDVRLLPGPIRVSATPTSRRGPPVLTRPSLATP